MDDVVQPGGGPWGLGDFVLVIGAGKWIDNPKSGCGLSAREDATGTCRVVRRQALRGTAPCPLAGKAAND